MNRTTAHRRSIATRLLAVLPLAFLPLVPAGMANAQTQTVQTQVTVSTGLAEGVAGDGVTRFLGLPYAAPPTGELRWQAPMPTAPWPGVRRADAFGAACPQDAALSLDQAGDPGPRDEDCLFVNVWTPRAEAGARLPVLAWVHGGAFVIGSASQSFFDGAALARRGAVVVTFNYRLGALGFFSHPALDRAAPGGPVNFGLLDQIAALKWVHDNVEAFGGDSGNVTVFGESAGAQSVLALFASPLARGLFHKGIAQSAYGIASHTRAKARSVGVAVASAVGLKGEKATLAELRAVPAAAFERLRGAGLSLSPSLVTGDAALPEPILRTFQRGREAALPLVVGNNSDEASVALAFGIEPAALLQRLGAARIAVRPLYERGIDDARLGSEVVRDVVFSAYARRIAYLHSARAPTWRYYFSRVPSGLRDALPGVPHGGEIATVFGLDDGCRCLGAPQSAADRAAATVVGDYWVAFASAGVPAAADGPAWPRDTRRAPRTMVFGDAPVVRAGFMQARLDAFIAALNVAGLFGRR